MVLRDKLISLIFNDKITVPQRYLMAYHNFLSYFHVEFVTVFEVGGGGNKI